MPTYRQALEKLMDNPSKLKAWKKKYGEASLTNFTKVSKKWNKDNPKKKVTPIKDKSKKVIKSDNSNNASNNNNNDADAISMAAQYGRNTDLSMIDDTKKKDKTKVEIGEGASNVLEGSTGVGKKPTSKNERKTKRNVERLQKIAKRGKNKEARLNRRADRIAARKGFEGSGKFLTNPDGTVVPDNEGLMKARGKARELMAERKQKGKDFWRNFGSQMVRGTQAPPKEGFQVADDKDRPKYGSMEDTPEGVETSEKLQKDTVDGKMGVTTDYTNQNMQNLLYPNIKDYTNFGDDIIKSGMGKRENNFQLTKLEEEDSTPQTAMNKIYKQKRGY